MGHSGPRMTSLGGGDRADGGRPSSCWSLALESADPRRAADGRIDGCSGLTQTSAFPPQRGLGRRVFVQGKA